MIKIIYKHGKWQLKRNGNIEENYIVLDILMKETVKEMMLLHGYNKADADSFIKKLLTLDLNENISNIKYKSN
nr:MAG TPA: hypothetical protein [Caudoviricetes sp.]